MKVTYPKIPKHEMEALARVMLPAIQEFFQSEEGNREFEAWKQEQEAQRKHTKD